MTKLTFSVGKMTLEGQMATDKLERECWAENKYFLGCDESGYGSLSGSLFTAGVIFPLGYDFKKLAGLNDSKKMTDEKRFELDSVIKKDALWWFCESASAAEIDAKNVYWLRFELAEKAINANLSQLPKNLAIWMDGNKPLRLEGLECNCLIKGDATSLTIAAASVIAKCAKNREMDELHAQHPEYGWASNKGYWHKDHVAALERLGYTEHHRRSYCKNIAVGESCTQ